MSDKKEKIRFSIKKNYNIMSTPLMSILPGQISFFIILSAIPIISILIMTLSKLSLNYDSITNILSHYLPLGVSTLIISIMEQQRANVTDFLFIITAFYLAAKATHSIIVASTQIYNGEQKNFIRTRIKAIIMLVILIMLVVMLIGILTFGSRLVNYLSDVNKSLSPFISILYNILKWPFVIFMMFYTVKFIYTVAPNVKIESKSVNKGAMLTTVIWTVTTYVYSFYITNIANYSRFYGNLSNIIILMIWIYWLCYVFVYGMTINKYKTYIKEE